MRKITLVSFAIVVAALLTISCGKIRTLPTSVLEMAYGGPDDSTYPFEASLDGFSQYGVGDNQSFLTIGLSNDRSYMGVGCVKFNVSFTGLTNFRGGVMCKPSPGAVEMAGKTLTAYVWVPAGMFDSSNPYGATFFIQLPDNDWYQSTWQNLNLPSGTVAGIWNKVSFFADNMTLANGDGSAGHVNGNTVVQNGANINAQQKWGIKIGMGDTSAPYTGTIYIDSLSIK